MSRLTPEKRMDKNGRLVTKHVKLDQMTGKSSFSAPPPPILPNDKEATVALILEPLRRLSTKGEIAKCKKALLQFDDETIRAAAEVSGRDESYYAQVIADSLKRTRNEGVLLVLASTYEVWGPIAGVYADPDGYMREDRLYTFTNDLVNVYSKMTHHRTMDDYALLSEISDDVPDFDVEESSEAFALELLGDQLHLADKTRTKRAYYRSLEVLNDNLNDVIALIPEIMQINKGLTVRDSYGNDVADSLSADQIKTLVDFSKSHPNQVTSMSRFLQERRVFDEGAIQEFLNLKAPALTDGVL